MAILTMAGNAIIPAPTVSFSRINQVSPDNTVRQRGWKIVLTGEMIYYKGSPLANGTWYTSSGYPPDTDPTIATPDAVLEIFGAKMRAFTTLFDQPGELLIQPQNGGEPIRATIITSEVVFQSGKWNKTLPYTITCEAQNVIFGSESGTDPGSQSQLANPSEESWQIEQTDEVGRVFKLIHNISSTAKKRLDSNGNTVYEGWQVAQALVLGNDTIVGPNSVSKLGFDQTFLTAAGVLDQTNFRPYNYIRSEQVDKAGGRFSVTETWTCFDPTVNSPTGQTAGKAIEDLSVETKYSLDDGLFTVNINGVVTGLEERDPVTRSFITSRYDNANTRFATITPSVLFGLAQSISGTTLNPLALSTTIAKNRITGVFQYSMSFNNRIANTDPSYLTETIEIEFNNPADVFAEIGVINRLAGPILQPIGSKTRSAATISISILVPTSYGNIPAIPITNPLSVFLTYVGIPNQLFLASDTPRWSYKTGRYSRTTTYVYQ